MDFREDTHMDQTKPNLPAQMRADVSESLNARLYWENNNFNDVDQKKAELSIPVAMTVFPGEI
jgi:hypothetical protein